MLQNVPVGENSKQNSCFLRANSSIFHEKIGSGILLVPKSRFYRFWMTFGSQNDLLLETLGSSNFRMATLGARFGDPLGPNLELFTKSTHKMSPRSSKCPPKVTKMSSQCHQNVNPNDIWTLKPIKPWRTYREIQIKVGGIARSALDIK